MGFDRWKFSPVCHAQPIATPPNTVPAQPTPRFPPCRPDVVVPSLRDTAAAMPGRRHTPESSVGCLPLRPRINKHRRAHLYTWRHCYPPMYPSRLTLTKSTVGSSPLTFAGRGLTDGSFHRFAIAEPIATPPNTVPAQPTTRFPPCRPDVAVSSLRDTAAVTPVRGAHPGAECRVLAPATTLPQL